MLAKRMRDLVGMTEASHLCGLSLTRLRYLADAGRIPMLRDPAGRRLLDRAAIMRLARRRRKPDVSVSAMPTSTGAAGQ